MSDTMKKVTSVPVGTSSTNWGASVGKSKPGTNGKYRPGPEPLRNMKQK